MIHPNQFLGQLAGAGIRFFTGVPDSLLKGLLTAIEQYEEGTHIVAANEGAAVGLAAGYHFATGGLPVVYLQNSGLGNLINPLTSLADREVYSVPMLLIVCWRGEPGTKDEPQHVVMGRITPTLLHQINVPFVVLKKADNHKWKELLCDAIALSRKESKPVALLVESGVFPEDELVPENDYEMSAAEAIEMVYSALSKNDIVVCTTGKIGRTFYQINERHRKISRYFLNVGSMGHAVSVATGIAMQVRARVVLFDGDGALLMHMGALALPPSLQLTNLLYILLNNGVHQSVGSQPTLGFQVDFCTIARGCGFSNPVSVQRKERLFESTSYVEEIDFLEIRINTECSEDLPRPGETPRLAKMVFMNALKKDQQKEV
jgi:phosphonopyruvate decarboxylase